MDVTTSINPVKIIEIADEDNNNNDVSVIYSTPRTSKRKRTKITNPISVEDYFENKNLEFFRSKASSSSGTDKVIIDLSKEYPDDEIQIFGSRFSLPSSKDPKGCSNSSNTNSNNNNNIPSVIPQVIQIFGSKFSPPSSKDPKGCSNSSNTNLNNNNTPSVISQVVSKEYMTYADLKPTFDDNFICEICVDEKSMTENFKIMGCNHSYCNQCTANYIASKLQQNITRISCPVLGCNGQLDPYYCISILPKQVYDRWGDALRETMILDSDKFYCPYKNCSALMNRKKLAINQSQCPECKRLFCTTCKVPWHKGIVCEEFQKLHKDEREIEDQLLMKLAKRRRWQRCPKCRIYVARNKGCPHMQCRCGCSFCYKCGADRGADHCKCG